MKVTTKSSSNAHLITGKVQRKANLDRIRNSLQNFALLKQNHKLTEQKISQRKTTNFKSSEDKGSSSEGEELKSDICQVEIFDKKYELLEKLGEGSNGVVHRCRHRQTSKQYAVKSFRFEEEHLPGLKANFLVMKNLRHENIIAYEALYVDLKKHTGWLVMQLIKAPSLLKHKIQSQQELKLIMKQLLDALTYLHRRDIVHRDIKPENILYDSKSQKIKLIDFGISRRYRRRGHLFDMWTITGTLYYRAPEMFTGVGYRQAVDVWAAGALLYKLVCGRTPFQSQYHNQTIKNILENEVNFTDEFKNYSYELKSLIFRMLNKNPEERLSTCLCLKDNWFSGSLLLKSQKTEKHLQRDKENTMIIDNKKWKVNCKAKADMSLTMNGESECFYETKNKKTMSLAIPQIKKMRGDEIQIIDSQF